VYVSVRVCAHLDSDSEQVFTKLSMDGMAIVSIHYLPSFTPCSVQLRHDWLVRRNLQHHHLIWSPGITDRNRSSEVFNVF
jgi:hypothetical protein